MILATQKNQGPQANTAGQKALHGGEKLFNELSTLEKEASVMVTFH
jgi:hypothetical protein